MAEKLIDSFGRNIDYVRISVTDRCDFRCTYCMAEKMTFLPRQQIMSLEEIEQIARAFTELGVRRIRLTGGEPLVRRGILDSIASSTNASAPSINRSTRSIWSTATQCWRGCGTRPMD